MLPSSVGSLTALTLTAPMRSLGHSGSAMPSTCFGSARGSHHVNAPKYIKPWPCALSAPAATRCPSSSATACAASVPNTASLLQPCLPVSQPFKSSSSYSSQSVWRHVPKQRRPSVPVNVIPEALASALTEVAASPFRDYYCLALTVAGSVIWVKVFDVLATRGVLDQVSPFSQLC